MIIYKATNIFNGRSYIGQTTRDLEQRKKEHYLSKKSDLVFQRAIKKHGYDSFIWEILCECKTKEELNEMEFHYIKQYGDYNMTEGGDGGNCGNQHTKYSDWCVSGKTRKKMSDAKKGKNHYLNKMSSEEKQDWLNRHRKGKNNPMYSINRSHSSKTRKKMSKSHTGKNISEETKKKIGSANKGSNNGMSKTYRIKHPNGKIEIVKGLRSYCIENNITSYKLKKICIVEEVANSNF